MRGGVLAGAVLALRTHVRAWPVCLRRVAREHVRALVCTLRLVPRCPQLLLRPEDAAPPPGTRTTVGKRLRPKCHFV